MPETLYYGLIGATVLTLLIWFARPTFGIRSQFDLFVLVWAYYALCVPLDLLLGLSVEGPNLLPDLHEPYYFQMVVEVTLHYYFMAIGFGIGYTAISFAAANRARNLLSAGLWWTQLTPIRRIPPLWLLLGGLVIVLLIYVSGFDTLHRGSLSELTRSDMGFFLLTMLVTNISRAVVIVLIVILEDRRRAFYVAICGGAFAIFTGGRTGAIFSMVAYLMRYDVIISLKGRLFLIVIGGAIAVFMKIVYVYMISWVVFGSVTASIGDLLSGRTMAGISLSRLEGVGGYAWPVYFFEQGASPLWLGTTYVVTPLRNTFPNFLTGLGVPTLALTYAPEVTPFYRLDPIGLGFSAVAEAWLNFGAVGPPLVGMIWGGVCKFFDTGPRNVPFMLVALMNMRFFRSDFASAYDTNLIVMGTMACLVWLLLLGWQYAEPRLRLPAISRIRGKPFGMDG